MKKCHQLKTTKTTLYTYEHITILLIQSYYIHSSFVYNSKHFMKNYLRWIAKVLEHSKSYLGFWMVEFLQVLLKYRQHLPV